MLQYRNTPIPELGLSPAQILFHRQLRDSIPVRPKLYKLHKEWIISAKQREIAFAKRNQQLTTDYNTHSKSMKPLLVGTAVRVQEKGKWNRTGRVTEILPYHQYRVKMDGSGRVTLRNRRFLKAMTNVPIPSPVVTREGEEYVDDHSEETRNPPSSEQPNETDNDDALTPIPQTEICKNQADNRNCQLHGNDSKLLRRIADHNNQGLQEEKLGTGTRCLRGGKEF